MIESQILFTLIEIMNVYMSNCTVYTHISLGSNESELSVTIARKTA